MGCVESKSERNRRELEERRRLEQIERERKRKLEQEAFERKEKEDDEQFIKLKSGGQEPMVFQINRNCAELSKFVTTILESCADATEIEIRQVPPETLGYVLEYLQHHNGKEPDPLPCPVRSIHMSRIVTDQWDAIWIDAFDKKTIFEIILAANYMDIKSLLHLGCAKIATL
eukprot:197500_1